MDECGKVLVTEGGIRWRCARYKGHPVGRVVEKFDVYGVPQEITSFAGHRYVRDKEKVHEEG